MPSTRFDDGSKIGDLDERRTAADQVKRFLPTYDGRGRTIREIRLDLLTAAYPATPWASKSDEAVAGAFDGAVSDTLSTAKAIYAARNASAWRGVS